MKISENTINNIKKHNACEAGIRWAENSIGADINTASDDCFLWFVGVCNKEIPKGYKKFFNNCAKENPWAALQYASSLLPANLLEWCAREKPLGALKHAASLLTDNLLKWCAKENPVAALGFAYSLLPPGLLKWCAENRHRRAPVYRRVK